MIVAIPHPVRVALGTRKHKVIVTVVPQGETVTATAPYWDGGSRTDTWLLHRGGQTFRVTFRGEPWPARPASHEVTITDMVAMVEGGTFRGKPSTLHLFATFAWLKAVGVDVPNS